MAKHFGGHESSAIAVPRILQVGAILSVAVITVIIVIRAVLVYWVTPDHALIVARSAAIPPPPRLQPYPEMDLAALRAQKQRLLSSWGWADPAHHFARIPVDRAMSLYLQEQAATARAGSAARLPDQILR